MSKVTVYGHMYQFSTRKNLVDILIEPNAIAILSSIALHALIAANLSLLIQPEKPGKKIDAGVVKVVELQPDEIQRIPQAPQPAPQPIPRSSLFPDIAPPPELPLSQSLPAPQPTTVNPKTVPVSPIRTTPAAPTRSTARAIPQNQPAAPTFSRNPFGGKSSQTQGEIPKPSPPATTPSPTDIPPVSTPSPSPVTPLPTTSPGTGKTGEESSTTPGTTIQPPPGKPPGYNPTAPTTPIPTNPDLPTGEPTPGGNKTSTSTSGNGNYDRDAEKRRRDLETKYRGLKVQPLKPIADNKYPDGTPCNGVNTQQYIIYMFVMKPIEVDSTNSILNADGKPTLNISLAEPPIIIGKIQGETIKGDSLAVQAKNRALQQVFQDDNQRPETEYSKHVLYQYKMQYDKNTCK
jgi:hypothetical protein